MRSTLKVGLLLFFFWVMVMSVLSEYQKKGEVLTFAVIGDYGSGNSDEERVANMVLGWKPDLIITTGDNYYYLEWGTGSAAYDASVGKYYCSYLKGITTTGTNCPDPGGSSTSNRFFPALGNHDYGDNGNGKTLPSIYTNYFELPGQGYTSSSGNERYYDFVSGPVHFFVLNSNQGNSLEPDGTTASSKQAQWLKEGLANSKSDWNIVYFHHPPFSSGMNGSSPWMQWPFKDWGADVVISGHDHTYERINHDGMLYLVNGVGGSGLYNFENSVVESLFRYNVNWGALKVTATPMKLHFEFYSTENGGTLEDEYSLSNWPRYFWLMNLR